MPQKTTKKICLARGARNFCGNNSHYSHNEIYGHIIIADVIKNSTIG